MLQKANFPCFDRNRLPGYARQSPLAVAAARGNLDLVKLLVESGADVNSVDACVQLRYTANPAIVMTDFEVAVIRATTDVLGDSVLHCGCFYHLTQSTL